MGTRDKALGAYFTSLRKNGMSRLGTASVDNNPTLKKNNAESTMRDQKNLIKIESDDRAVFKP